MQNSLSPSTEVAVVIGFSSCASTPCRSAEDILGTILYNGPFKPVYHETNLPPYENFTVTLPSSAAKGKGQINVAHASLIGVGFSWLALLLKSKDANYSTTGWSFALLGVSQSDCGRCIGATSGMRSWVWRLPG